jgi:hypothetical protein
MGPGEAAHARRLAQHRGQRQVAAHRLRGEVGRPVSDRQINHGEQVFPAVDRRVGRLVAEARPAEVNLVPSCRQALADRAPEVRVCADAGQEHHPVRRHLALRFAAGPLARPKVKLHG